jgi:arabinoxylan arabinofuranohydrolase
MGVSGARLKTSNPISPPGVYIADPTARVWKDGKLYIYGSADENCDYYCSHRYHMLVTEDMRRWELVKNVFSSRGEGDEVPYNDNLLFAPSAAYKDGTYYLYYCQPDREHAEGVATSTSPTGPFTGGQPMDVGGYNEIDPGVFIDDDGQAYYYWGQFTLKMAKLKPNMKELDRSTIRDSVLTESEHFFHEGAFMTKINGLYYLVYADISRGDIPTAIGYATASAPWGPYTYGGVIIDNNHCNPGNWNNHGSIAKFNGQWYVFYHRSTHGCNKMRKAAVEPIEILADGSIPEVEMTSQGAGGPIDARRKIQAAWACILNGNVRIERHGPQAEGVAKIKSGDKAAYKYIDFGAGVESMTIRLAPGSKGGRIVVSQDKPWHRRLAQLEIEPSENGGWQELTFPVERAEGIHALWLHFYGDDGELFTIDWFRFR